MLKRGRAKRVVDITNQEAAVPYVRRAESAERKGEYARANRLYQSAVLHDPTNVEAQKGAVATHGVSDPLPSAASSQRRLKPYRRPLWKQILGIR
jgi:hypothetical protein